MKLAKIISLFTIVCALLILMLDKSWAEEYPDYLIGPSDLLKVSVWDTPGLDVQVPVRPDGKISFPLIGDVTVAGLTSAQIQSLLVQKLSGFTHDPQVSVLVLQINSSMVYIHGAVARPGEYKLDRKTNLLELFCKAGGVTNDADLKRAYFIRQNKRVELNFQSLMDDGDVSQNIDVQPRDIVFIPPKKTSVIIVLGEVNTPQVIPYAEDMNVLDAIFKAGGFSKKADQKDIKVIRQGPKYEEMKVNASAVLNKGEITQNIKLMPADIIIVGESWL